MVYNKLVRDKIPEICAENGQECVTEILSGDKYLEMLDAKLCEEMAEYQADKSLGELADLLEVVYAIAKARYSIDALEAARLSKREKRGGFDEKIFLVEVK